MTTLRLIALLLGLALELAGWNLTFAEESPPSPPEKPAEAAPLPHIVIDQVNRHIDLDGTVILREGKWLELLATKPGTREHEAIITIAALPSHVHLALIMLGLEPGHPIQVERVGDEFKVTPPKGPRVLVSVRYQKEGQWVQEPAASWIRNQKTDETLADSHWLFTGSKFHAMQDKQIYAADVNGSIISLVNFGDDVLTRATTMTQSDDDATWGARTDAIPAVGTKVVVRLKPVDAKGE